MLFFSDCNANKGEALVAKTPDVVRFDVVKTGSYFAVPELLRKHFLAEVLVPSPIPPHLIIFPKHKNEPPPKPTQLTSS